MLSTSQIVMDFLPDIRYSTKTMNMLFLAKHKHKHYSITLNLLTRYPEFISVRYQI